jgi:predicted ATP-grasp superfamily ATP-dependent carboligase
LTLGRLPKALELARCLHSAGFRVVVAEPFRWHLCRPSRAVSRSYRVTAPNLDREAYLAELVDIIRREDIRLVVPVSEEALHVAALKNRLSDEVRVLCEDVETLASFHDKLRFAQLARSMDLTVPDTFDESSAEAKVLMESADYVAKPAHSCSGIGVQICRKGIVHDRGGPGTIIQRFVEGDHLSSLSLLDRGREIFTVIYRGTVFSGTVAVCFERVDHAPAVRDWISSFCRQSPHSGFFAFDFIVDDQGAAWAIECNPRVTSGVHFLDSIELARAIVQPESVRGVDVGPGKRMQWAYSTLTEAYAALFRLRFRDFRRRMHALFTARDVVWSPGDPLPFLLMTPMSWEILWPAMTSELGLGEATQRDIAWFSAPSSDEVSPDPSGLSSPSSPPGTLSDPRAASSGAPQDAPAAAPEPKSQNCESAGR